MGRKKKKNNKRQINYRQFISCVILFFLVLILSFIIFKTNFLKPHLNELTTSYISFNNKNTTDMLKIVNLEKMTKSRGMSSDNKASLDIKVMGEVDSLYEIIVYPITNNIDLKDIDYSLHSKNKVIKQGNLGSDEDSNDEGKIIYQGIVNNKELTLKMWVKDNSSKRIDDNSFEVKIKPR